MLKRVLIFFILSTAYLHALDINRSLVEVHIHFQQYDDNAPWDAPKINMGRGSGFVIAKNLVMTNAHVAANAVFIMVRLNGFAKKFIAKSHTIGYDCDLALLEIEDPEFHALAKPLEFGEEVKEGEAVTVMGFPLGQEGVSWTKGIVSRSQVESYVFSGARLYCTQVDAAINPGNSGGPVIHDGKVVGVAFQGYFCLQNMGYIIPMPVIDHFLRDAGEGAYKGFPVVPIKIQTLENPSMRKYLGLSEDDSGVMVSSVYGQDISLQEKDVILKIDGTKIENDASIIRKDQKRVFASTLISQKFLRQKIDLEVLRNGKVMHLTVPLNHSYLDLYHLGGAPAYFIYAGLVFQADDITLYDRGEMPSDSDYDVFAPSVRLTRVFPDMVNIGYHHYGSLTVSKVNGREIYTIEDIIKAFKNDVTFHHIELLDGYEIILHKESCDEANPFILQRYGICSDRNS